MSKDTLTENDITTLNQLPDNEWFAGGAYSLSGQTLLRLERLGYLKKRITPNPYVSRIYDWFVIKRPNNTHLKPSMNEESEGWWWMQYEDYKGFWNICKVNHLDDRGTHPYLQCSILLNNGNSQNINLVQDAVDGLIWGGRIEEPKTIPK